MPLSWLQRYKKIKTGKLLKEKGCDIVIKKAGYLRLPIGFQTVLGIPHEKTKRRYPRFWRVIQPFSCLCHTQIEFLRFNETKNKRRAA